MKDSTPTVSFVSGKKVITTPAAKPPAPKTAAPIAAPDPFPRRRVVGSRQPRNPNAPIKPAGSKKIVAQDQGSFSAVEE